MIKKILLLCVLVALASCGSGRSTASRSSVYDKGKSVAKKPVQRTPRAVKTTTPVRTQNAPKSETLEAVSRVQVTAKVVEDYIATYKGIAQQNMRQHKIPASITLAQGILESGAGTGSLSVGANNHFGIKCHKEWTGPSVRHDDDEAQECFRKYDDPAQSYQDHSLFLTSRARYASLFQLPADDYKAWARGLRAAGYATDIKYPEKLIGLIERYQLNQYDAEVLGRDFVPMETSANQAIADNVNYYRVNPGDTLYSISRRFNLSVDELKRLNALSDNAISIGQQLKIK